MIKEITVHELKKMQDEKADFFLLDVRERSEYDLSHLGGHLIPLSEIPARLDELDSTKLIVVHCRSGGRSRVACELLLNQGFTRVANLTGGIMAWSQQIDPKIIY